MPQLVSFKDLCVELELSENEMVEKLHPLCLTKPHYRPTKFALGKMLAKTQGKWDVERVRRYLEKVQKSKDSADSLTVPAKEVAHA